MEFADFSGGAAVIEALRSGAADIGSIGEAPVPIAVDSGVTDLVTDWAAGESGHQRRLLPGGQARTAASPRSRTFAAGAWPTRRVPGAT